MMRALVFPCLWPSKHPSDPVFGCSFLQDRRLLRGCSCGTWPRKKPDRSKRSRESPDQRELRPGRQHQTEHRRNSERLKRRVSAAERRVSAKKAGLRDTAPPSTVLRRLSSRRSSLVGGCFDCCVAGLSVLGCSPETGLELHSTADLCLLFVSF